MPYGTVNADLMTTSDGVSSSGLYGFKNRIINGAMVIDQRNAGASVTQVTGNTYTVDRFYIVGSVTSKFTAQQSSTVPSGFVNSLKITSSATTSLASGDYYFLAQLIEGYNIADLNWGSANAKTITLSFQVYSSLTGTFGGALRNSAQDGSYPFTYSIPVANTWTTISITIAGDTSGTWLTTNGTGINVVFALGIGSTYSGTAGAWAGSNLVSATGATSVVGTNGATFFITGVQLEKGSTATSFDYRPYGTELALCQRYYWKIARGTSEPYGITGNTSAGNAIWSQFGLPVTMRATPTVTIYGTWVVVNTGQPTVRGASSTNFLLQIVPTATGIATAYPDSSDDLIDASIEL